MGSSKSIPQKGIELDEVFEKLPPPLCEIILSLAVMEISIDKYHVLYSLDMTRNFHGGFVIKHKNVKIKHCHFSHGILDGHITEWFPSGFPKVFYQYMNGKINGDYVCNYTSGALYCKAIFKDGLLHGRCRFYYNKIPPRIQLSVEYYNGVHHGTFIEYDPEGEVIQTTVYENGKVKEQSIIIHDDIPLIPLGSEALSFL